ncbi:hypothetical protein BH09BAC4_BH09BAC4_38600 [soil metagenome]
MKDYYYILGVNRTATPDDIKLAYRKLSLKFHPDKNDGDKFFEERFKEINEAYDILSNSTKRFNYDESFPEQATFQQPTSPPPQDQKHIYPPRIIIFSADKLVIDIGDTITFRWKVENATSIELKPFGLVPSSGERKINLKGFNSADGLLVLMIARNDRNSLQAEERLFLKRKSLQNNPKSSQSSSDYSSQGGWVAISLVAFFALILSTIYLNNENKTPTQPIHIASEDSTSTMITDSTPNTVSDPITSSNTEQVLKSSETTSPWKGNQLTNGNSPFNSCFGKGERNGPSWILFQNRNGVDAVVCLINSTTGLTVRNEYIRAGGNFEMSNVPVGMYYVKALYGNDWNPNLISPCGSKGFFESDISFSASDGYNDTINIETSNDGYAIHYSTHTITLQPVINGNMSQHDIDASQFFGR